MLDLVMLIALAIAFAAAVGYVGFCRRALSLGGHRPGDAQ